jgi:hypothetical protein
MRTHPLLLTVYYRLVISIITLRHINYGISTSAGSGAPPA